MNTFLKMLDISFRRDPYNFRPRINKHESQKDQIQKAAGNYYQIDDNDAAQKTNVEGMAGTGMPEEESKGGRGAAVEQDEEESKADAGAAAAQN
jgi:hypothetical protein